MSIDASADYLVWDNPVSATVKSKSREGFANAQPIATALRRAPTWKELSASNGAYTGADVVWLVPETLLGDAPKPKPGDVVLDSEGTAWTVLEASYQTFRSVWRLVTRNLVLAHQLRDTITIERATIATDATGAPTRTWAAIAGYEALAARVQKITDGIADVFGVRQFVGTYAVIVAEQVTLTAEDRVKWIPAPNAAAVYLDVKALRNPSRIDELPVLDCELIP